MTQPTALVPARVNIRNETGIDAFLTEVGRSMQILGGAAHASRPNPAGVRKVDDDTLPAAHKKHAAGLMRVNHVGEVCAQALYRGQALFCENDATRHLLHAAAQEETDHLAWCQQRLSELDSRPSLLNPLWYGGSFLLGVLAGKAGVPRNLGFMAETERQVEQHLDRHLAELPGEDMRSRSIVSQMRTDEIAHRTTAESHGAMPLAWPVKLAMRGMSKIMTTLAYRI